MSSDSMEEGEVHLWDIPLDPPQVWLGRAWDLLSGNERERADQYRFPFHRTCFIAARAALRSILAAYTGGLPGEITFAHGPSGKPDLLRGDGLQFNLAHSGSLALLGLTRNRRIGVDLEFIDPDWNLDQASSCFSADEQVALRGMSPSLRREAFFRCWARKEAFLKALGTGIGHGLQLFTVSLAEQDARLLWISPSLTHAQWTMAEVPLPGYAAAFVVEYGLGNVERKSWSWGE